MILAEASHGLGPGERGALAHVEERCLSPRAQRVEPLFGLARGARVLRMHVEAVGAAVELRRPRLHEFEQPMIKPGLARMAFEREHDLETRSEEHTSELQSRQYLVC